MSRLFGGGLVTVVMAMMMVGQAVAGVVQVTDLPAGKFTSGPTISSDGGLLTFTSNGNLGGLNPAPQPNVFVYDMRSGLFTRVTTDTGFDPMISSDGRWIAFTSSADYAKRNADGSDEIFRYDRVRKRFNQLTKDNNGDGSSELAAISGNGKRVAFETSSNLRRRNADFSNEVYLFNRSGNIALSVDSQGDGESHTPAVSGDGKVVAFVTTSNLTGRNEDLSQELMIYDVAAHDLSQATNDPNGDGESSVPAVSGDGHFVAFISSSNVAGLNPDNSSAVYLRSGSGHYSIISKTANGVFDGDVPAINEDGHWIAFLAAANVTQGNPDFNQEVLLYNRIRKTFTQVTDGAGCFNLNPKISGNGARIAFQSNCDYVGTNADHTIEVFVADNPALNLVLHSEGPVGLLVTDPDGRSVAASGSTIPNATYAQGDFDGDTVGEVRVTIPQAKEGQYRIQIIADAGAVATDAVTIDGTLNDLTVPMAADTVATLGGTEVSFSNQGFSRRASRMTPLSGTGSKVFLSARMRHPRAAAGAVKIRFSDGSDEQLFDFGRIEDFNAYGSFKGTVDGFSVKLRVIGRSDGSTSVNLSAKDGDLSEFAGTSDISMVMVVQVGPDTDMYNWRFKRRLTGDLILK